MFTGIVFVLMVFTHGTNYVPTLEFSSREKCQVASKAIKDASNDKIFMGSSQQPFCVRIEK